MKIENTKFGNITIDGKTYEHDPVSMPAEDPLLPISRMTASSTSYAWLPRTTTADVDHGHSSPRRRTRRRAVSAMH
jgi:hypothetical protein